MHIEIKPHSTDKRCCIIDFCLIIEGKEYWNSTAYYSEYVLQLPEHEQLKITKNVVSTLAHKFLSRFDNVSYNENDINFNKLLEDMKNLLKLN